MENQRNFFFSIGIGLFPQSYRPAKQIDEAKWLLKWTQIDEHNAQLTPHTFNQNYSLLDNFSSISSSYRGFALFFIISSL